MPLWLVQSAQSLNGKDSGMRNNFFLCLIQTRTVKFQSCFSCPFVDEHDESFRSFPMSVGQGLQEAEKKLGQMGFVSSFDASAHQLEVDNGWKALRRNCFKNFFR